MSDLNLKCENCSKGIYRKPYLLKKFKHFYCSNECRLKVFNTNRIPWNKGTKGICKPNSGSIKKGQRLSPKTEFKNYPHKFKGNISDYKSLHYWVTSRLGRPKVCEHCGSSENRVYHWANKSGNYLKDLSDWLRLCVPCHQRYDGRIK